MPEPNYPWGGEFTTGPPDGCVAVVLLNIEYTPPPSVAIFGKLKTENIGIEKIVANVISNPHIRFVVVCGEEIRGHRSGSSLLALHRHGIDTHHRIIDAPGAIPYIENLSEDAITRFREQISIIDYISVNDSMRITAEITTLDAQAPPSFGEPYIAIRLRPEATTSIEDARALHAKITIDYLGRVKRRGE
jgi:tetrahydromethanopterin S-methyltransferase subunit A